MKESEVRERLEAYEQTVFGLFCDLMFARRKHKRHLKTLLSYTRGDGGTMEASRGKFCGVYSDGKLEFVDFEEVGTATIVHHLKDGEENAESILNHLIVLLYHEMKRVQQVIARHEETYGVRG